MSSSLLHDIYDVGEAIHRAIRQEDVGKLFQLVEERADLVRALDAFDHPSEIHPKWKQLAARLAEQRDRLDEAVSEVETGYTERFEQLGRMQQAQDSYQPAPVRKGIIHENVQG